MYVIAPGAVSNVFNDVRTMATYDVISIIINDEFGNHVIISNGTRFVFAYLTQGGIGAGQLKHLPINYASYNLYVQALSMADIDAIEQWRSAESVEILVDTKPSEELSYRIHELSKERSIKVTISRFGKATEDMKQFLGSQP